MNGQMIATAASPQQLPTVCPPAPTQGGGVVPSSVTNRIGNWFADRFGSKAMPASMIAFGAAGAGLGVVTLGPVGGIAGGLGGAWLGALLVGLRN